MNKLEDMDQKYKTLFTKFNEQVKINERLQGELTEIKKQLNKKEQAELKNNLIVQGIPYKENEDLKGIINKIGENLEVPVLGKFTAYRMGKDNTKNPSIKVVFDEEKVKISLLKSKKKFNLNTKGLGYNVESKIFLNHDLTKANLLLYKAARIFKKENEYKFLWIGNGNILLRKDENSKVILLDSEDQLEN